MFYRPYYDEKSNRYLTWYFIPRAKIPARKSDVVLRTQAEMNDQNQKPLCQPILIEVVLRKAEEPVKIPRVSMNSYLAVKKIEVVKLNPNNGQPSGFDTEVRVTLRYTGAIEGENDPIQNLPIGQGEIVDSTGRDPGLTHTEAGFVRDFNHTAPPYTKTLFLRFSQAAIPISAGPLFFKAEYSLNDGWPLKVRIPLRDAKGRVLLTKNTLKLQ